MKMAVVIAKHVEIATISPSVSTTAPDNFDNMYAVNTTMKRNCNRTKQGHHIVASLTSVTEMDIDNVCTDRGHIGIGSVVSIEGLSEDVMTPRDDHDDDDDLIINSDTFGITGGGDDDEFNGNINDDEFVIDDDECVMTPN